ncbi:GPI-anchored protein LLG2-like [Solanum dulcamara]|uniref:GPI-anchored protein LLG2-like n=1 Tax=Solanum dulcamara TaxID=45834 RepID=UPI002485E64F|nr:GPI-anchored protein LLG2-like [Solanum dulcamara]
MGFQKFFLFLFFLLFGLSSSSPSYIKYDVVEARVQTGRALLQQQGNCPIDFERENYTIITSQCKGPHYNSSICCNAFKQLACKHTEEINDVQNGCATTMFNYINLYGKYPPGLFANMCKGDKEGLNCKDVIQPECKTDEQKSHSSKGTTKCSTILMVIAAFLIILMLNI